MHPLLREWRPRNDLSGLFRSFRKRDFVVGLGGLAFGLGIAAITFAARPAPPREQSAATTLGSEPTHAASDKPDSIKIVGAAAPSSDRPCAEQTWPYIDRRCLTEAAQRPVETPAPAQARREPATPVALEHSETTGTVPRAMSAAPDQASGEFVRARSDGGNERANAEPGRNMPPATPRTADRAPPDAENAPTSSAHEEQPKSRNVSREQRRAERKSRGNVSVPAMAKAAEESDDPAPEPTNRARPQRSRSASQDARRPREVKRWRELVYEYPDGRSRRVIIEGRERPRSRLGGFFPAFGGED